MDVTALVGPPVVLVLLLLAIVRWGVHPFLALALTLADLALGPVMGTIGGTSGKGQPPPGRAARCGRLRGQARDEAADTRGPAARLDPGRPSYVTSIVPLRGARSSAVIL